MLFLCFPAQAIEVTYSKSMCRLLADHTPDEDVAFEAGVDVKGRGVIGADLNDYPEFFGKDQSIAVPITKDLAEEFDISGFSQDDLRALFGIVTITEKGRVLNQDGKDLTGIAHIACANETSGQ